MSMNETTTTAIMFLGVALGTVILSTVIAVQRGEMDWAPGAEEVVEAKKPSAYINFGGRPTFAARPHNTLKRDKPAIVEEPEASFNLPALDSLGLSLSLIGIVWLLAEAFGQGAGWGCAVLFGNLLGGAVFLFAHPQRAWRPFSVQCVGYVTLAWALIGAS
jgi:hypothetical protein